MKIWLLSVSLFLLLSGCGTKINDPVASGSNADAPISALTMTCISPYKLTQGCSVWALAAKEITVSGYPLNIAATADGHVVLIMENAAKKLKQASKNDPEWSSMSNRSFMRVRDQLVAAGVHIIKARPVVSVGTIDGYLLELDGDGYAILGALSQH